MEPYSREQRPHFGQLAVAVAVLALGGALFLAIGDDRGPVLGFLVAVLGRQRIGFAPDFIGLPALHTPPAVTLKEAQAEQLPAPQVELREMSRAGMLAAHA